MVFVVDFSILHQCISVVSEIIVKWRDIILHLFVFLSNYAEQSKDHNSNMELLGNKLFSVMEKSPILQHKTEETATFNK